MKNSSDQKLITEEIVEALKRSYNSLHRKRKYSMLFALLSVILAGISALFLVEQAAFLSSTVKSVWLVSVLLLAVLAAVLIYRYCTYPGFKQFYEDFFHSTGQKNVLSAVDLHLDQSQKKSRFYQAAISSNLASADIGSVRTDLQDYTKQTSLHGTYRKGAVIMALTAFIFAMVSFNFTEEVVRSLHFWESYTQPNPYSYTIAPADTTIEHGSSINMGISFSGNQIPDNVILEFKTGVEDEYRQRQMQPSNNNNFVSPTIDLTNSITYHVVMDGFVSEEYTVNVQLQPRFDELIATVTPPSYTGLSQNRIEYPFSQINIYPGSEIKLAGKTNKTVSEIAITGTTVNQTMDALDDDKLRFETNLNPQASDTLRFEMTDTQGLKNRNPFRTVINQRQDQYPTVVIHEPTGTVMKTDPRLIDIFYQATDDFGLTRAELVWSHQRAFVDEAESGTLALERPGNGRTEEYRWDVSDFELRPRDQLVFSIRVWDNDEVSGYKMSESQQVVIQVPSLTEYFEDLDSQERDMQSGLDELSENFDQMEAEYEEFLERMRQNPEGGFEESQMLEEIRDRQQNIDETVRELNERFNELRQEMQGNDRISDETRRAYQELQQLMEELDDPALREAMEELQRALENLSPQELERALENVSFNEQLYKERIQRTVELFKRLKMNSDLDKLARQYEDMAERMLNEDTSEEQLSRELSTIRDDLEKVSEQLEQLDSNPPRRSEERLRQIKEEGQRELESIREKVDELMQQSNGDQNGLDGETDGASNPLENREQMDGNGDPEEDGNGEGASSPTEQMQQQISQQMQAEAERFRSSIQQMGGQQLNVNILALQRALYTLLELSDMQEYLTQTASETRNRSLGFVDLARLQRNVSNQFSHVADTLYQVSAELPGVPNQINRKKLEVEQQLGRTLDNMVERNQRGSTITTRESLGGINDLTSMIASLIDQLMDQQNGGGGGGMSMQQMVEQLQNMSGDQQQLNQQLQDLINDVQGDRLTRDESERLDQIARQQNEIRRQLQELQRSGALDQGDRMLSELQRMLEDMEDSINEMRGGVTDPLMVERQQNILSRMLNAEEALQQRGEEEEREGTRATEYDRILPPDITLEELQQEIRSRMQDPNYTRFSEQYQRLIERYFEQLRRIEEQIVP